MNDVIDKLKSIKKIMEADLNVMAIASQNVWQETNSSYPLGALNYPIVLYILSGVDFLGGVLRGKFNQGESKDRTIEYI